MQILDSVTAQEGYKDGLFYLYVVSYEPDAVDQVKLLQHGEVNIIINKFAHELTYNDKLDRAGNDAIGRQLAKDVVSALAPTFRCCYKCLQVGSWNAPSPAASSCHTSPRPCVAPQIAQSKEGGGWVAYSWYRPAASTHANPTNKKYAYIMPMDYSVPGSTEKFSIGIENGALFWLRLRRPQMKCYQI